jgi:predicted PurR-regulated permease PerM
MPDMSAPGGVGRDRRVREWPILLVLTVAATGLVIAALADFRTGSLVVAIALLLASALRIVLPQRDAGLLAVRRRWVDVLTLGLLGTALGILAFVVPE